jgi:hypothetical protein
VDDVYRESPVDYLTMLREIGAESFRARYRFGLLLEGHLAPSSRAGLGMLHTVSEGDRGVVMGAETRVEDGLHRALVIPLEKKEPSSPDRMIFVGRAANNDMVLLNEMVSKVHAYFCKVPGSDVVQVVDMNSTNGTFVNGQRLLPLVKRSLEDKDELRFGPESRLIFFTPTGFCELLAQLEESL